MDLNTITDVAVAKGRADLAAWRPGDAFVAGGTWLFSEPQPHLSRLIDLAGLGWAPLVVSDRGLEIAATCKVAQLDAKASGLPVEWTSAPLIGQCCRAFLASFKIWNMATVGGNVCMSLPAGPMISFTASLGGICTIWSPDGTERQMPVTEFVLGPIKNALAPGEVLRKIDISAEAMSRRTAFRQISLAPLGRSGAVVIATLARSGTFTLTVTASVPRPYQVTFAALPSTPELRDTIEAALPPQSYYDDVHGDPAWRRHMTLHFAEAVRRELAERAS